MESKKSMQEGMIGIIVPVYKVEKYVAECIESILTQTYTNFRLILVDDGTPDNAGKICDEYAQKDPRITVIHQENAGVTRARARGVEEASDCEFITFVDSDDKLYANALAEFIDKMNEDTDIVFCTSYSTETVEKVYIYSYEECKTISNLDYIRKLIGIIGGMTWSKLFRKKLFDKSTFDIPREVFYGEDALMNLRIAFNCNKGIRIVQEPLYFYRQHNESVCSRFLHSHEYEELLRIHILKSIPSSRVKEFSHEYILRRMLFWRANGGNGLRKPTWAETPFHKQLKKDVEEYNFKMTYFERLLLFHTGQPIRSIIYLCRKINSFCVKLTSKQT